MASIQPAAPRLCNGCGVAGHWHKECPYVAGQHPNANHDRSIPFASHLASKFQGTPAYVRFLHKEKDVFGNRLSTPIVSDLLPKGGEKRKSFK